MNENKCPFCGAVKPSWVGACTKYQCACGAILQPAWGWLEPGAPLKEDRDPCICPVCSKPKYSWMGAVYDYECECGAKFRQDLGWRE